MASLHYSILLRVGLLAQSVVHDTTAPEFYSPSSAIRLGVRHRHGVADDLRGKTVTSIPGFRRFILLHRREADSTLSCPSSKGYLGYPCLTTRVP